MDIGSANSSDENGTFSVDLHVGKQLRKIRTGKGFSLRELADRSGLNVNTLSLIENGKSSPSVSTLQQLAQALEVPIAVFFESEPVKKNIVFTKKSERPKQVFGRTEMQNLGKNLVSNSVQPFVVTLQPGTGSGDRMIVHTGFELVYCISGTIRYLIEQEEYLLYEGDSLVFAAHLPHCWEAQGDEAGCILLVLYPSDENEKPGGRHFSRETLKKEINMKVAVITDDGKSISQHFGRAPYYLVATIEEGKIVNRETRNKLGHDHFHGQHDEEEHGSTHGMDAVSHGKHISMAETISDCSVLLCGGMGMGAYDSMRRLNIQPIVTDIQDIDDAIQAFIDGKLVDHTELLH